MSEKNYGPGKKATYTYEEVRPMCVSAMKDRAKYMGVMYKAMPREQFDEMGKKAFWNYGAVKHAITPGEPGKVETMANFLVSCNSVANTCDNNEIIELTPEKAILHFNGKCALVAGWEEMGLSREEVKHMCEIACFGDYGHADSVGLKAKFNCTSADGIHEYCEIELTKK